MEEFEVITARQAIVRDFRAWLPRRGFAAFAGAWGMLTGFALFVVVEENLRTWWVPVGAVVAAALGAAVVEWLRAQAEGHSFGRVTLARVLSFLVLIVVFELFIYAFHDLVLGLTDWRHVAHELFGADSVRGIFNLVTFVGLWLLLAAALGSALAGAVEKMPHLKSADELAQEHGPDLARSLEGTHRRIVTRQSLWIGTVAGLKAGLITIPLIVLAYAVAARLGWATIDYWFGSREWRLPDGESWLSYLAALLIVGAISEAIVERSFGFAAFLVAYVALRVFVWFAGGQSESLFDFAAQLWRTVLLAVEVGAIWAAPAVVLGLLAPFLRRPAQYPWLWSPLALAAAAIMIAVVVFRSEAMLIVAAVPVVAAGLLLRSPDRIEQLWPLLAASVATVVGLAAAATLNATPLATYRSIDAVVIPAPAGAAGRDYLVLQLAAIDAERCPGRRIAAYEELYASIGGLTAPRGMIQPDRDAMRAVVAERRALEESIFEGALLSSCESGDRSHETRPFARYVSFNLTTVSALGFWLTLGLLGVWRMRDEIRH